MADIERVKKIEALARELMKHGFANNIQDAVSQAEKATQSKSEVNIPSANPKAQENKMTDIQYNEDFKRLSLQVNQQKSMITEVQSKMNEMIGEINKFDKKIGEMSAIISGLQQAPVQKPVQEQQPPKPSPEQAAPQQDAPAPQPEVHSQAPPPQPDSRGIIASSPEKRGVGAAPEVRTGQFKPGDFNINKIFYSGPNGNKK